MLEKTKIGVCIDYRVAYLLEEKNDEKVITIIEADVASAGDEINADAVSQVNPTGKNHGFYNKVSDLIMGFDQVSLLAPDSVKNEILKRIKGNSALKMDIQNEDIAGKISENQKIEFINTYFANC